MYTIHVALEYRSYDHWLKSWGEALHYANQQISSHPVKFACIDREDGTTICSWNKGSGWTYFERFLERE